MAFGRSRLNALSEWGRLNGRPLSLLFSIFINCSLKEVFWKWVEANRPWGNTP